MVITVPIDPKPTMDMSFCNTKERPSYAVQLLRFHCHKHDVLLA